MYFKRKIDSQLKEWLHWEGHSPALIIGTRQCGKTESVRKFGKENFPNVVYINFWKDEAAKLAFMDSLDVDVIVSKLSYLFKDSSFIEKKTLIILDEIQDCPRARLALKSFKEDPKYEVIATGSYIGLNLGSGQSEPTPQPVGAEDILSMRTMDFEEFLWANGYTENQIDFLYDCLRKAKPIPEVIHRKMISLFRDYICVGGYPEAVKEFLASHQFNLAYRKNRNRIFEIKGDPAKRKDTEGHPIYTSREIARIQNVFDLVSQRTLKENKRFLFSQVETGSSEAKRDAVDYLVDAGVVFKVHNLETPSQPLFLSQIPSDFKLCYSDVGILTTVSGFETIQGIQQDRLGMAKGYLYESVVAESLYKAGFPLYYFRKNSGLEIDFVISFEGEATLIESKAKSGNVKSSKTVLSHPEHYGKTRLIKIGNYNIGFENDIWTIPYYLIFLLERREKEFLVENGLA